MQEAMLRDLRALIGDYVSGRTLPRDFYTRADFFDYEMAHVLNDTWWFARHSSELAKPGAYAVINVGRASIIVMRGKDKRVRAFNNVCGHRAAKLCKEGEGTMQRIVCPYHSWTYALDGALLATQYMPEGFKKEEHSLREFAVAEHCGLIFINLAENPRPFEELLAPNLEVLRYHGMENAQLGARHAYTINANWKLATENFTECYHCAPSHQTLTKVMSKDRTVLVRIDPADPAAIDAASRVQPRIDKMQVMLNGYREKGSVIPNTYREPLAPGFETGSIDGKMMFKPMTPEGKTVGTESVAVFEVHTGYINLYEDYAVLLSYLPLSHDKTMVELSWFISGDEPKPDDARAAKLMELWDITTREDSWLSENQVEGVMSPFYKPGTLSNAEIGPRDFLDWYIGRLNASFSGAPQQPHRWI